MKTNLLLAAALALSAVSFAAAPKYTPSPAAKAAFDRATALAKEKDKQADAAIAAFAEAIETDPDFLAAHKGLQDFWLALFRQAYADAGLKPRVDGLIAGIQERYRAWEKRWPDSVGINYGYVQTLHAGEDPAAKPYLRKIVKLRPDFAEVWAMLSSDAERWGDEKAAMEYMRKAAEAEPDNPDYAFYYAFKKEDESVEAWEKASLEVVRRFPDSERAPQALYWLGYRTTDDARKLRFFEWARRDFPAAKFRWTASAMDSLFDVYLRLAPDKALALAKEMVALGGDHAESWKGRQEFAEAFAQVKQLVDARKFDEADALIEKLTVDRRSPSPVLTLLLKAEVLAGADKRQEAYDLLLRKFAAEPDDQLFAGLARHGAKLGKDRQAISADAWAVRDAGAKPAPAFDLGLYTSDQTLSLASLKGKVVFVTFWFPGCGPCRGEFPHFENVVRKFQGNADLVYLGINGIRKQDDYVLPFMAGTKYSFIPLKGGEIDKAYGVRGYPSNFLIDRDGRIIFSNFRTDGNNELLLQRMIETLLARPAGA